MSVPSVPVPPVLRDAGRHLAVQATEVVDQVTRQVTGRLAGPLAGPLGRLGAVAEDVAYVGVGLAVLEFQRLQVRRRELTKALAAVRQPFVSN